MSGAPQMLGVQAAAERSRPGVRLHLRHGHQNPPFRTAACLLVVGAAADAAADAPRWAGDPEFAPGMVLVRFKQTPRAAGAAAVQASQPLPGLELKRLVGRHQGVRVGADFRHASGRGSLQRTLKEIEALPPDALMLFSITDGSSVPTKVAQLKAHAGRHAAARRSPATADDASLTCYPCPRPLALTPLFAVQRML